MCKFYPAIQSASLLTKKGRLTKEKQGERIIRLLSFIFMFRYAIREQLEAVIKSTEGLSYPARTIETCLKKGYIKRYHHSLLGRYIYYLGNEGKKFIFHDEPYIEYYRFDSESAALSTYNHHNFLIETFFMLKKIVEIKEWTSEFVLRIGKRRGDKCPDGQMDLPSGLKIAIEVEAGYKNRADWKGFTYRYTKDIERYHHYDAVFIMMANKDYLTGAITKLFDFEPELALKRFIFSDTAMLKMNECFYRNETRTLQEAFTLVEKECISSDLFGHFSVI